MNVRTNFIAAGAAALGPVVAAAAQTGTALALDMDAAIEPVAGSEPEPAAPAPVKERVPFGSAGSKWWTIGGGFAYDFGEEKDYNVNVGYSEFLADDLEFGVEVGGWYFAQDGDDTGGISGQMVFRWHLWHAEDWRWSVFGEAGIGLLAGFDEVPNGGTEFNFVPRVGGGYTRRIGDDGTRLLVGLRWHHISNGRYEGDGNNPSRDSIMVFAGVMIPF